jgi:hypothetical protein
MCGRHTRAHHTRLAERKAFAADVARTKDGAVVQALLDMRSDGSSRRKGDRKL